MGDLEMELPPPLNKTVATVFLFWVNKVEPGGVVTVEDIWHADTRYTHMTLCDPQLSTTYTYALLWVMEDCTLGWLALLERIDRTIVVGCEEPMEQTIVKVIGPRSVELLSPEQFQEALLRLRGDIIRQKIAGPAVWQPIQAKHIAAVFGEMRDTNVSLLRISLTPTFPLPCLSNSPSATIATKQSEMRLGKLLCKYDRHHEGMPALYALAWSPDSTRIASACFGKDNLHVWDAASGRPLLAYKGHRWHVGTLSWSPDGTRLASTDAWEQTVHVWDAQSGERSLIYQGAQESSRDDVDDNTDIPPTLGFFGLAIWSPDSTRIASAIGRLGTRHPVIRVWDAATGELDLIYDRHCNTITALSWSPDGRYIASASEDQTVQIWHAVTGERLICTNRVVHSAQGLAWSPDGTRLVSAEGYVDQAIRVWQWNAELPDESETLLTYYGHSSQVEELTWSPDGKRIASGDGQGKVQIWHARSGERLYTYQGHVNGTVLVGSVIGALAWSPDGTRIASALVNDRVVHVWQAMEELAEHKKHIAIECYSCREHAGVRISPGPTLYAGKYWLVEHAYPTSYKGWLVIVARRHVEALHDLNKEEFIELADIQYKLTRAMRQDFQIQKEYMACFSEAEHFQHIHVHVIPRPYDLPSDALGPKVFSNLHIAARDAVPSDEIIAFCEDFRKRLEALQ